MAGAGLIAIKRRIKSVTNTRKITKAMGLVATAKLRRARENLTVNDKYYSAVKEAMDIVMNNLEYEESLFLKGNHSSKKLFIVFTSDSGLCGGFNSSVVSQAVNVIKADRENSIIMVIGQKGRIYFNKFGYETAAEYVDIPDIPTMKEAKTIYDHALKLYNNGEVGEIHVVYTKFISPVKQIVTDEKILPVEKKALEGDIDPVNLELGYKETLESLIHTYMKAKILNSMVNAKVSEHGSRMSAMDGATKNANDLLEKLNLRYNRIRQSAITQEISEIVGGAEAQR